MVRDGRSELGFTEVSPGNDLESLDLGVEPLRGVAAPRR